MKEFDKNTQRL